MMTDIQDHSTERETPTRVFANGTRIPVADVDVHLRKEGPLDITRYAEFSFPTQWDGTEWLDLFEIADPDEQTSLDTVRIDVRDRTSEDYGVTFQGIVTGVGPSAGGPERMFRCRAQGPGHFLSRIEASRRFGGPSNSIVEVGDVLEYLRSEMDSRLPFPITVADEGAQTKVQQSVAPSPVAGSTQGLISAGTGVLSFFGIGKQLHTPKTFQSNRHTLDDVADWVDEMAGVRIWLEPTPKGAVFVGSENPTQQGISHRAHYLDEGNTAVVENNALVEIRPVNTVTVNGEAKRSLIEAGEFELNAPTDTYTKVKARHRPLYERADETEIQGGTVRKSSAESKAEVINEARSILKERVDETTQGEMLILPRAPIRPFDTIRAKPTCDTEVLDEGEPITYEVQRVHHKLHADKEMVPHTELTVGIHTDMEEDIEIIGSWEREA
jgi:hypothetical protein